jgi:hypothetical protein
MILVIFRLKRCGARRVGLIREVPGSNRLFGLWWWCSLDVFQHSVDLTYVHSYWVECSVLPTSVAPVYRFTIVGEGSRRGTL